MKHFIIDNVDKRGVKINGGWRSLLNLINGGGGGVGISKHPLISVMNEKRDMNV